MDDQEVRITGFISTRFNSHTYGNKTLNVLIDWKLSDGGFKPGRSITSWGLAYQLVVI